MAKFNAYDKPTVTRRDVPQPPEFEINEPNEPIPQEVREWLRTMGWSEFDDHNNNTLFSKADQWEGHYYTWSEAIALEQLKFMTIGNVGQRRQGADADMAMSAGNSAGGR